MNRDPNRNQQPMRWQGSWGARRCLSFHPLAWALCLILLPLTPVSVALAQEQAHAAEAPAAETGGPTPTSEKAAEPAPAQAEDEGLSDEKLLATVLMLADKEQDEATAASLIEIANAGDTRAILALKRVYDNHVVLLDGKPVYMPDKFRVSTMEAVPEALRDHPVIAAKFGSGASADIGKIYDLFLEDEDVASTEPELVPLDSMEFFKAQRNARKLIKPVINILELKSSSVKTRGAAAKKLGDTREASAIPDLQKLAESDANWKVRYIAEESIQLMIATGAAPGSDATPGSDAAEQQKLDAVTKLGEMKSIRAHGTLTAERSKLDAGSPALPVYDTAIARIDRHISVTNWVKNGFFGLSLGSILVLLALGLAITFGLMGVINMAHGEMLMVGAVTTWACYEFISPLLPSAYFSWYYVIAFPLSFLAAAAVGLITELCIVRFLYKRPLDSLLATIGVSLILIQAVRLWKGDNLGMTGPVWLRGGWEVILDVTLAYNRLFLICLTTFCILMIIVLFRYTKLGLMIRATSQNREMAQALGVNTRLVDMFSFAFGAGLAGLAGYGLVTLTNPTPEMGQTYIVKSFLVTVVGGVGKLIGVIVSGLSLGFIEKTVEPIKIITEPTTIFDSTWSQVFVLILVVLFMTRRPAGLFPDKGRLADQQTGEATPWLSGRKVNKLREMILGAVFIFIGLVLVPGLYAMGLISTGDIQKYGQWVSFAICAIGLDLVWGYVGVLSLCQFMFFSLGGYCMGLYLINHGPMDGPNGDIPRALFVVMSAVSGAEPPFFLSWFRNLPGAVLLGLLLPGLAALVIGVVTFSSRVRGVYFAILTQAITVAVWLVFQKNDLKLGGTNGLTNFTRILGKPIAQPDNTAWYETTRFWLYIASVMTLIAVFVLSKWLVHSRFGRVLVAIRDDETRLRFVGYKTWVYKAAIFAIAGIFAAIGGMLYVPQKGIITPHQLAAFSSILVVVWVAVGGRGTLWGPVIGAILVNLLYDRMTSIAPDYWMITLGGLFILVPLLLPGGVMSLPQVIGKLIGLGKSASVSPASSASASLSVKEASA